MTFVLKSSDDVLHEFAGVALKMHFASSLSTNLLCRDSYPPPVESLVGIAAKIIAAG